MTCMLEGVLEEPATREEMDSRAAEQAVLGRQVAWVAAVPLEAWKVRLAAREAADPVVRLVAAQEA